MIVLTYRDYFLEVNYWFLTICHTCIFKDLEYYEVPILWILELKFESDDNLVDDHLLHEDTLK